MARSGDIEDRGSRTIGDALLPRSNSLNLIRLLLASLVVLSHAVSLGGYGSETILGWTSIRTLAVFSFFGISGYLIAGSAEANGAARFLWHRLLRIFPAYWACLALTAAVFGWLGWMQLHPTAGLSAYLHQPAGPVGYVVRNSWLHLTQISISGTLAHVPFPYAWNGSIWTLFYEFICYLIIGVLAFAGAMRHRIAVVGFALGVWVVEIVITSTPVLNAQFDAFHHWELTNVLRFVPVFLVGSIIYLYRHQIPDSSWLAFGSVALMGGSYLIPVGAGIPAASLTRSDLSALLLVYPILWLGAHLPGRSIGVSNDYSYGLYIYAFPAAQLLALWGVFRWGYLPYVILTFLMAGALAVASWWLIEKRSLRLKDIGRSPTRTASSTGQYTGRQRSDLLSSPTRTCAEVGD